MKKKNVFCSKSPFNNSSKNATYVFNLLFEVLPNAFDGHTGKTKVRVKID